MIKILLQLLAISVCLWVLPVLSGERPSRLVRTSTLTTASNSLISQLRAEISATNNLPANVTTNDFVLNTRYTNGAQRGFVSASIQLTAAAAGTAQVSLYIEHDIITNKQTVMAGPLAALVTSEALLLPISANARYYFSNETSGVGASVSILAGTSATILLP